MMKTWSSLIVTMNVMVLGVGMAFAGAFLLLGITVACAGGAEPEIYTLDQPYFENFRGNRMGSYPRCRAPVRWDEESGYNIVWKSVLPNWCYGLPIVVNDRVFVMSEAGWKSDFPELVCLCIHSGKILWQKQIDHMPIAEPDEEKRAAAYKAWGALLARFRAAFTLAWETNDAHKQKDASRLAAAQEEVRKHGWSLNDGKGMSPGAKGLFGRDQHSSYGILRGWGMGKNAPGFGAGHPFKDPGELAERYGLNLETFWGFGDAREGNVFASPVTDGKAIYVVTAQGAYAAFDLDGNRLWLTWRKPAFPKGGHDDSICRTPVLIDGVLIIDQYTGGDCAKGQRGKGGANPLIGIDARTGEVRWEATYPPMHDLRDIGHRSSFALTLGDAGYYISLGGVLVRAKDGKISALQLPEGKEWSTAPRILAVDDDRDLAFGIGGGLMVLKLTADADGTVQGEVVRTLKPGIQTKHSITYHAGILHSDWGHHKTKGGIRADMRGDRERWRVFNSHPPRWPYSSTRWFTATDGRFLYYHTQGKISVRSMRTGRMVATNTIFGHRKGAGPEVQKRLAATFGTPNPQFSYSSNFTLAGNRVLVRSNAHLYCIGDPCQPFPITTHLPEAQRQLEQTIAAISTPEGLQGHLRHEHPRQRYLALRRLGALPKAERTGAEMTTLLSEIASTDPYPRVRAAAITVLGLDTDGSGAGGELLRQQILDPKSQAHATLDALGARAVAVLRPLFAADRPQAEQLAAAARCVRMLLPPVELRDALLELGTRDDLGLALAVYALSQMFPEPEVPGYPYETAVPGLPALMERGVDAAAAEKQLDARGRAMRWLGTNRSPADNIEIYRRILTNPGQDYKRREAAARALCRSEPMPLEDLDRVLAAAATMDGTKATAFLDTVLVPLQPSEAHVERMVAGLDEGKLAVGLAHRLIVTGTAVDKGLAALDARRGIFQTHGLMPLFRVGSAALEHVARHGNAAQQQAIVKLIGRFFAERKEVGGNDGRMIAILGHIPTQAATLRPALEKIAGTTPQKHNEKVIQAAQALLTTIDTAAAKGATENGAGP